MWGRTLRAFFRPSVSTTDRNESHERARKVTSERLRETQSSLSSAHPSPHRGPPSGAPIPALPFGRPTPGPKSPARAAPKGRRMALLAVSAQLFSALSAEEFWGGPPSVGRNEALSVSSSPRLRTQFSLDSDQVSEFRRANAIPRAEQDLLFSRWWGCSWFLFFILFARSIVARTRNKLNPWAPRALRPRRFICEINGRN